MKLIKDLKNLNGKIFGNILFNADLSKLSWFNIGGPAKVLFKPNNLQELSTFLKEIKGFKEIKVLGAGSNTLIRDGGFDGVVIKFGKSFAHLSLLNLDKIVAGVSSFDKQVSNFALENSLSGLEFLSCIPGTIGGAIRMNSGCYGEDISGIVKSVQAMDINGNIRIIHSSEITFYYRGSDLDSNLIFISATLQGKKNNKLEIKKKIKNMMKLKENTQPSKIKTCGSTFKNPKNNKAWRLIKDSGCAGMRVGGAKISEKHCNFFVNNKNAKSKDLERLIDEVKNKVLEKTGVNLELEIQIIGKKL